MRGMDLKSRAVNIHQFSMAPQSEIPRSKFKREFRHLTTFDAGYLVPVYLDEVLPGDTFQLRMDALVRMSTPIFPFMDSLRMEAFFFFVPNRLVWQHWVNFMGEQANPTDSIAYSIPQIVSPANGYPVGSVYDYMGLPTVGQIGVGNSLGHSALPLRAYFLIYDQWFRDENLQTSAFPPVTDGPDANTTYYLLRRGKRFDYFTGCLPWTQKGGVAVTLPFTGNAIVKTSAAAGFTGVQNGLLMNRASTGGAPTTNAIMQVASTQAVGEGAVGGATVNTMYPSNLYADLSTVTATTINAIRLAVTTQQFLERDARGGTRYTELIWSHFRVKSPDARLQRAEYLGGGMWPVNVGAVPQTSATGVTGGSSPQGTLAAFATAADGRGGFTSSFTEHGHIIGMVSVQADLTYSQGMRRLWSRATRYDFYDPVFANLGEQAVLNVEIYAVGALQDGNVFGYQERWSEYKHFPSLITSVFRPTAAGTLAAWHASQLFAALPTLNATFIQDTPPISRVIAAGAAGNGQQFIADFFFSCVTARPMPVYSVPGLARF